MLLPNPHLSPERAAYFRAFARRRLQQQQEELSRAKGTEEPQAPDPETLRQNQRVREATASEWNWLRNYTETYNQHWQEEGLDPYMPFPDKPYFPVIFDFLNAPGKVKPVDKSRDLMISWAIMGWFTLQVMRFPEREVVVQTMEETKAHQLIDYAKTLYRRQPQWLRDAFPISKPIEKMAANEFAMANGSVIWGIPGGAGKIKSYHPWGYFNDETAFQAEAGICYDETLSAVQKIILNSTAWPSWYFDWLNDREIAA